MKKWFKKNLVDILVGISLIILITTTLSFRRSHLDTINGGFGVR